MGYDCMVTSRERSGHDAASISSENRARQWRFAPVGAPLANREPIGRLRESRFPGSTAHGHELDRFAADIAEQCGVSSVLILRHAPEGGTQVLGVEPLAMDVRRASADYREHAMAAAAKIIGSPFAPPGSQFIANDRFQSLAFALDGGIITITGQFAPAGSHGRNEQAGSLETIMPLLAGYLGHWSLAQRALARVQSLSQAIECCGMATILLGADGEIIQANSAAESIFAQRDGLCRNGKRLACASFSETLRLQAALDHFHGQAGGETALSPILAIPRARRRPLTVALTAARPDGGQIADEVRAIAYVFDPEQDLTDIIEPVCRLKGLSHSETKLTCALVAGQSLSQAASQINVQEQTARSYLKQIFVKTETNRQAELVQLMLKSAIRLSSARRTQAFL